MPLGMGLKEFPYMTGTDSRSFNLALFGGGSSNAVKCLLTTLQYDASVGEKIDKQAEAIEGASKQAEFISKLSASDGLNLSLYRTVRLMNFFRTNVNEEDPSIGGNTDGNPDVLTASEIENWAWKLTNEDEATYKSLGGDAISRVHALLGLLQFVSTPPPPVVKTEPAVALPESPKSEWTDFLKPVPQGVWWVGGTLAAVGIALALRRRNPKTKGSEPTEPKSPPPLPKAKAAGDGGGITASPKIEVTINNAPPAKTEVKAVKSEAGYDDVIQNLSGGAPSDDVLNALNGGEETGDAPADEAQKAEAKDEAAAKAEGETAGKTA